MDSISDEAEMFLRTHHLDEEILDKRKSMVKYFDAKASLESMGFEVVEHVCDSCMFVVRGGQIAVKGDMEHD